MRYQLPVLLCAALTMAAACSDDGGGGSSGGSGSTPVNWPTVPSAYSALYSELDGYLDAEEAQIDAQWSGSRYATDFGVQLDAANGNRGPALLTAAGQQKLNDQIAAFAAMGADVLKIDITYPLLTQAYHNFEGHTQTAQDFINYYASVASAGRAAGMKIAVEHGTLFTGYTVWDPAAYFADMKTAGPSQVRIDYAVQKAAEAVAIAQAMAPDYFALIDEVETQNTLFGPVGGTVLYGPSGWASYVQYAIGQVQSAAPAFGGKFGAGSATWEDRSYALAFAGVSALDYVDLHVYPLTNGVADYMLNVASWADDIRAVDSTKAVSVGECWLYKASVSELSGGIANVSVFARDLYSFWQPLDIQFLEILYKLANYKELLFVVPYWSQYHFAYADYDDPNVPATDAGKLAYSYTLADPNITAQAFSPTGQHYMDIMSR